MNDALFPIVVISILLHRETLGLVQNLRMERELLLQVPLLSFSRLCRFLIIKSIKLRALHVQEPTVR